MSTTPQKNYYVSGPLLAHPTTIAVRPKSTYYTSDCILGGPTTIPVPVLRRIQHYNSERIQSTTTSKSTSVTKEGQVAEHSNAVTKPEATWEGLPVEILWNIMGRLSAADLISVRSTAKKNAAAGRRFLCVNVNVTETIKSFERLVTITRADPEIANSIKHLHYMAFDLCDSFGESCRRCRGGRGCNNCAKHRYHPSPYAPECVVPTSWKDYEALKQSRQLISEETVHREILAQALERIKPTSFTISIKNLVRETVENFRNGDTWTHIVSKPSSHKLYNDLRDSGIVDQQNSKCDQVHSPIMTRSFLALLAAVSQSGVKMESLDASTGLGFLMRHPHADPLMYYQTALSNLKELKLNISLAAVESLPHYHQWDVGREHTQLELIQHKDAQVTEGILAKLLQEAKLLETVHLQIVDNSDAPKYHDHLVDDRTRMSNELRFLGRRTFEHMVSLTLSGFFLTIKGLAKFIRRHSKTLKHVTLHNVEFENNHRNTDFWALLFRTLRNQVVAGGLALESFHISGTFVRGEFLFVPNGIQLPQLEWEAGRPLHCTEILAKDVNDYVMGRSARWNKNVEVYLYPEDQQN